MNSTTVLQATWCCLKAANDDVFPSLPLFFQNAFIAFCTWFKYEFKVQVVIVVVFYQLCVLTLGIAWTSRGVRTAFSWVCHLHRDKWAHSCNGARHSCQQPYFCNREQCVLACPVCQAPLHLLAWTQNYNHMLLCGRVGFLIIMYLFWGWRQNKMCLIKVWGMLTSAW